VRLAPAAWLQAAGTAAQQLDEANPGHWRWESVRAQRLVWHPDGTRFLARVATDPGLSQLWLVSLTGSNPVLLLDGPVEAYAWTPDGQAVVYTFRDADASAVDPFRPYAMAVRPLETRSAPSRVVTGLPTPDLPGLTPDGLWFFNQSDLWMAPYTGGPARLVRPGLLEASGQPRPSPDGRTLAFRCGRDLCLSPVRPDPAGEAAVTRVGDVPVAEAAWAPAGDRLAVVARDANFVGPVRLVILGLDGQIELDAPIAPLDVTEAPEWTPDGELVLVQTFPHQGRRIIAAHLPTGQLFDLSQEHWDAYFALSPDGQHLLLNNGRGGFWLAGLIRGG
jgi:Tol biopolymer transport system component